MSVDGIDSVAEDILDRYQALKPRIGPAEPNQESCVRGLRKLYIIGLPAFRNHRGKVSFALVYRRSAPQNQKEQQGYENGE